MTLLFFEGFENKEPLGRASVVYEGFTPTFVAGRSTGSAVTNMTTAVKGVKVTHDLPSTAIYTMSGAFRFAEYNNNNIVLMASRTVGGSDNWNLLLQPTGQLMLASANNTTSTSAYAMNVGEWARIDVVANQANAGWAEVWVNGVKVIDMPSSDFLNGTTPYQGGYFYYGLGAKPGSWIRMELDDAYILDGYGPAPYNTRLGDVRIEMAVPSGNGSSSGMTGSDGNNVDNYQLVDEFPASAVDYVVGTAGAKDLYAFSNLSMLVGTVHAVQTHIQVSKTDVGAATIIPVTKVDGVEHKDLPLGLGLVPTYGQASIRTTAPDGTPWTVTKVNDAEFGVEVG